MKTNRSLFDSPFRGMVYLLPGLAVYLIFILIPVLKTAELSLFTWDGLSPRSFAGLGNYRELLSDPRFTGAVWHNLVLIFYLMVLPTITGLLLATLMERGRVGIRKVFEVSYFVPQILSMIVVGVIWRWIYNPAFGVVNSLLEHLGLGALARPWLGKEGTALSAVGLAGSWVNFGFAMVIFLAGYSKISPSLYESADIDGAGGFRKFISISLPSLVREIRVVSIFLFILSLKTFDLVYIMTKGGPGFSTSVLSLYVYKNAFQFNRPGYASALAVTLALMIFAVSFLVNTGRRRDNES